MQIILPSPLLLLTLLLVSAHAQTPASFNMQIVTQPGNATMVTNGTSNSSFVLTTSTFDCSLSSIYTYTQTSQEYNNRASYYFVMTGLDANTSISVSTRYNNFDITFTPPVCVPPSCEITINNHCSRTLNSENYFDLVTINVTGFSQVLSYYVKCDDRFLGNTFEWGLVLEVIFVCVLVYVVALYSKAWSLGGRGFEFNVWFLLAVAVVIVMGGIIGHFSSEGINICLVILSFVFGILGVGICVNQVVFIFRFKCLLTRIFTIRTFEFRILEVFSLMVGTGTTIGWWFSNSNIILNDILCVCISVACIKILKFTSLKMALLAFIVTILLELGFSTLLYVLSNVSYNNLFLNEYNYPFELQMPAISPAYNQKCAWLPFTVMVFPGMLYSYLRRFDSSRNTTLYLVTAGATFFIGGIAWMFITLISPISLAFGLISEPCLFGLIIMFAHRRRELRVLWDGHFYDEEFVDREDMKYALEMIEFQSGRGSVKTIDSKLIQDLKQKEDIFRDSQSSTIRSKFLKWRIGSDMNDSDSKGRGTSEIKVRGLSDVKGYMESNESESDKVKSNPQTDLKYTPNERSQDNEKREFDPSINNNNAIKVKENENSDSPVKQLDESNIKITQFDSI